MKIGNEIWDIHQLYIHDLGATAAEILNDFHIKHPLKKGMAKEEFKQKLFKGEKSKLFESLLDILREQDCFKIEGQNVAAFDFEIKFTIEQQKIGNYILKTLKEGGYSPPKYVEMESEWTKDKKNFKAVYQALSERGDIVIIDDEIVFEKEVFNKAYELVMTELKANGKIHLAGIRDLLNTSRKYAMAILDYLDKNKITKRVVDDRVLS